MKLKHGIAGIVVSVALASPMMVMADPGKNESGNGNCWEHKVTIECKGNEKHKNKNKQKSEYEYEYESEGEYKHTAVGPPPWAPAHGWRAKHGEAHNEYTREREYERPVIIERGGTHVVVSNGTASVDVGIEQGTCNRKVIGTVVGGVIGGVLGNRVGNKDNRDIATVLGAVIGGVVGSEIGSSMDKADQSCTGQVLEQAHDNQTVRWADHNKTGEYSVTPLRTYQVEGKDCRDFVTEYQGKNGIESERSSACRNSDGAWSKNVM